MENNTTAPTGFRDRSGREICEGDIVAEHQGQSSRNLLIERRGGSFFLTSPRSLLQFDLSHYTERHDYQPVSIKTTRGGSQKELNPKYKVSWNPARCPTLEVIGNVRNNPELLA